MKTVSNWQYDVRRNAIYLKEENGHEETLTITEERHLKLAKAIYDALQKIPATNFEALYIIEFLAQNPGITLFPFSPERTQ